MAALERVKRDGNAAAKAWAEKALVKMQASTAEMINQRTGGAAGAAGGAKIRTHAAEVCVLPEGDGKRFVSGCNLLTRLAPFCSAT